MNRRAAIVAAVRTPIGRYGGALSSIRPDDLAAIAIKEAVAKSGVDPNTIDDVYLGAANQAGEDNRNVARMAALLAGLPQSVPGSTVNRLCASGLEAINVAARMIEGNCGDVIVAGGVESMSRAPLSWQKVKLLLIDDFKCMTQQLVGALPTQNFPKCITLTLWAKLQRM